nr:hypothetical protein [Bacteroidaceae bacterium]
GNISFKAIDAETEEEYELTTVLPSSDTVVPIAFQADVLGSFKAPLQLRMETATGISDVGAGDKQERYYNLQGQRIYKPTQRGVYIQNGQKVVLNAHKR